ncbi:hypothetical protein CORC01_11177 [Colletotrichum orchidophilum]|uniref:Uncharacterized protein n=1 Tax=Colletotrichum orchidophilum TaxID=1209926 RepID=A0A1G4AWI6_9PEZI|nr:uncharacterized protein CORC01_11177 [Colletotrichum orchidophilum]OHE93491.1 hypothetical protein CORC01_11177 [Colletotrichum orchidophilum]
MTAMLMALGWVYRCSLTRPHQRAVDKRLPDSRVCSCSAREDAKPRLFGLSGSNMRTCIMCGTPSLQFLDCTDRGKQNERKSALWVTGSEGKRKRKSPAEEAAWTGRLKVSNHGRAQRRPTSTAVSAPFSSYQPVFDDG